MQRSSGEFRTAVDLVRNGVISKVERVECSFGDPGVLVTSRRKRQSLVWIGTYGLVPRPCVPTVQFSRPEVCTIIFQAGETTLSMVVEW